MSSFMGAVQCVSGLYMLIEIRWTKIALIHKEYRFEILFPDLETNVVPELPLPVQEMSADEWHIQKR